MTVQDRFQILALDGGGVKALFAARVLARLEEDLDVIVADQFDLIAGTSAGGIIALALGAGLRPAEIAGRFEKLAKDVFPASRRSFPRYISRLWRSTYDQRDLREALGGVLGDRRLGDSHKRLLIPSFDLRTGGVHIFKTPHHQDLARDWRIPMVDVALATSAAPTYLPAAQVDGHRLVDGGVWANNPSVLAIAEAISVLDAPVEQIRVLNVGTTDEVNHYPDKLDQGGCLAWMRPAADVLLTASSRGAQGTAEHLVGKDDYERFDAQVPAGLYALDQADPDAMAGLASTVSRELSPTYRQKFAGHQAGPYQPLHPSQRIKEHAS